MKIHEKRWYDLSQLERKCAVELMLSHDIDEGQHCDVWDRREADIFNVKFSKLPEKDKLVLRSMGLGKDKWIAYDDPVPPLEYTNPTLASVQKRMKQIGLVVFSTLVCLWVAWMCIKVGILSYVMSNFGVYILGGIVVAALLGLVGIHFWTMLLHIEESIIGEVRVIFQHLKDVWAMLHHLSEILPSMAGVSDTLHRKTEFVRQVTHAKCQSGCTRCSLCGCFALQPCTVGQETSS